MEKIGFIFDFVVGIVFSFVVGFIVFGFGVFYKVMVMRFYFLLI